MRARTLGWSRALLLLLLVGSVVACGMALAQDERDQTTAGAPGAQDEGGRTGGAPPAVGSGKPVQPANAGLDILITRPGVAWGWSSQIAFSIHGNITRWRSPLSGVDTFNHFPPSSSQGYALCRNFGTGTYVAYDEGGVEANFGGPATVAQPGGANTLPITFTRTTTDGVMKLTRKIDYYDQETHTIHITNTVRNLSGSPITGVRYDEYGDVEADFDYADDLAGRTTDSAWVQETGSTVDTDIVMLTTLSQPTAHSTAVHPFGGAGAWVAATCNQPSSILNGDVTGTGDWVVRISHSLGTINAGAQKSVRLMWQRS